MDALHTHNLYKDIQSRTGGEIYIGVVAGKNRKIHFYQTIHGYYGTSVYDAGA